LLVRGQETRADKPGYSCPLSPDLFNRSHKGGWGMERREWFTLEETAKMQGVER